MKKEIHFFKDVTLLVTHYNRSRSLEHLLESFLNINCLFEDIVVSDDGSKVAGSAVLDTSSPVSDALAPALKAQAPGTNTLTLSLSAAKARKCKAKVAQSR